LLLLFASGDLDRFTLVLFISLITFLSQIFYREWLWSNMGGRNSADQFPRTQETSSTLLYLFVCNR
jgi:hypothetical protein